MVINRIRLDGLIYSLESFLQLNMCRDLQIFAFVCLYLGANQVFFRLCDSDFGITPLDITIGPPLWSSGQSFWLLIQRSRVRFPALPDFLSSSGSGTGSTQPREVN